MLQDIGDRIGIETGVDGVDHGAGHRHAEQGLEQFRCVGGDDGDGIALADAPFIECARQFYAALVCFGPCRMTIAVDQRRMIGEHIGRTADKRQRRQWHEVGRISGQAGFIVLQRHVVLPRNAASADERQIGNGAGPAAIRRFDLDFRAGVPVTAVQHGKSNIGFEVGRIGCGRDMADTFATAVGRPPVVAWRYGIPGDCHAAHDARHALVAHFKERFAAEEVIGLVEMAETVQRKFQRIVPAHDVGPVTQQSAFDTLDQVRAARTDVEILAGLPDGVPQRLAEIGIFEIKLEPALFRPAGARHKQGRALKFEDLVAKETDVADVFAKNLGHDGIRFRSLDGERPDPGLLDLDVEAEAVRQALCPQHDIGIGDRQPKTVVGELENHRVVDDAAALVGQRRVDALADNRLGNIARRHEPDEARRVGPLDFDLAFATHVPDLHVPFEVLIVAVERTKRGRQKGMIVDRVALDAGGFDARGIGRAADPARRGEKKCTCHDAKPDAWGRRLLRAGPFDVEELGAAAGEIPDPAKVPDLGFAGLRDDDVRTHPVLGVGDDHVALRILAADRVDGCFDLLRDREMTRPAVLFVTDRHALEPEIGADQKPQDARLAAGLPGEDFFQPGAGIVIGGFVDIETGRPVSASHVAGDVEQDADLQAAEVDVAVGAAFDQHAGPALAVPLGRRVSAERYDARAEHRATAV